LKNTCLPPQGRFSGIDGTKARDDSGAIIGHASLPGGRL
jgi:hypothetical protein